MVRAGGHRQAQHGGHAPGPRRVQHEPGAERHGDVAQARAPERQAGGAQGSVHVGQVPQGARLPQAAPQAHRAGEEQAPGRHQEAPQALLAVRANHQGAQAKVRAGDEGEDAGADRPRSHGGQARAVRG